MDNVEENSNNIETNIPEVLVKEEKDDGSREFVEKKKPLLKIIVITAIILLLIAGGLIVYYQYIKSYPKEVFITAIDKLENNFINKNKKLEDVKTTTTTMNLTMNATTKDTSTSSMYNVLNKINANFTVYTDIKNSITDIKLNSTYDGTELLNAEAYYKDENMYLLLENIYSKYISVPIENQYVEEVKYSEQDLNNLVTGVLTAFKSTFKDSYFSKSKVTTKINGKEVNLNKSTLKITEHNYVVILNKFFDSLINNKTFIKSVTNLIGESEENVVASLKKEKSNIKDNYKDLKNTDISIYTKGLSEAVKFEVVNKDNNIKMYVVENKKDDYEFSLNYSYDTYEYRYRYWEHSRHSDIDTDIGISNPVADFPHEQKTINIKISYVLESNDKAKIIAEIKDGNDDTLILNMDYTVKYNEIMEEKDISNSIPYTSLTEEDYNNIYTNLLQKKGLASLIGTM